MEKVIIYRKPATCVYGTSPTIDCMDYTAPEDFKEVTEDYKVLWAKIIDLETGKVFKSHKRKS